jgi:DNA-binding MarR family transcriptional regulator
VEVTARATADQLAAGLIEHVGRLRRALRRGAGTPWPGGSLTGAQLELARLLRRNPGLSVNSAADELNLAPNTVSSLVGQLVDADLVRRTPDARDRRVARLDLTPGAQRRLEEWRDERTAVLRAALDELPSGDRRALERALPALDRLVEALDA